MTERPDDNVPNRLTIRADQIQALIDAISDLGYEVLGPTVRDKAVVYDHISSADQLPAGFTDTQDGGSYRLQKSERPAYFDHVVGPHNWKRYLYPPIKTLWSAGRRKTGFKLDSETETEPRRMAFFGVRACDLQAIAVLDRVLMQGDFAGPDYCTIRDNLFVVAVNCTRPSGTCFCTSMGTGPKATHGFDLALTELFEGDRHYFMVEVGTVPGQEVASALGAAPASSTETAAAEEAVRVAAESMGRKMPVDGLYDVLKAKFDDPHWEEIAERCLTCGNCTMVCPTCFCVNIEDRTDLKGDEASRVRLWDSCFTLDFSYIYGGSIRLSGQSRYRQWMIHKLGYWLDQFGVLGCVGCGRCITWCPVGIDITEEARVFMGDVE